MAMAMEMSHKSTTHQHPFSSLLSEILFTCDACGIKGDRSPNLCTLCDLIVHKDCVSLPPSVKILCHPHPLAHKYYLQDDELVTRNCRFCHHEVDAEYGSYCCSNCDYIVHVNCALSDDLQRCLIAPTAETGESESEVILRADEVDLHGKRCNGCSLPLSGVVYFYQKSDLFLHETCAKLPRRKQNWAHQTDGFPTDSIAEAMEGVTIGETSEVENGVILSADEVDLDGKNCERCLLPLSGMVYFYQERDLFIHEACAKLASKKQHWAHQSSMTLFTERIFSCSACGFSCTGFGYKCGGCNGCLCLRCSLIPDEIRHQGHKSHPLTFHYKHEGPCSSCGEKTRFAYRCKDCDLTFDFSCLTRPSTTTHWQHDEHPLTLLYQDEKDSAQCYCDICQKERIPSHWFYGCGVCNNFKAHPQCVLGEFPFVKRGGTYMSDAHPHPLTTVDINNDYYECEACGDELCDDLALKCSLSGCSYIVHWKCMDMEDLRTCEIL